MLFKIDYVDKKDLNTIQKNTPFFDNINGAINYFKTIKNNCYLGAGWLCYYNSNGEYITSKIIY